MSTDKFCLDQAFFIFCDSIMIGSVSHSKVHIDTVVATRQLVLTWQRAVHVLDSTNENGSMMEIDKTEACNQSDG